MKKALSVVLLTGLMAFVVLAAKLPAHAKKVVDDQALLQNESQAKEQVQENTQEQIKKQEPAKTQEPAKVQEPAKADEKAKAPDEGPVNEQGNADYDESLLGLFEPAKDMYVKADVNVRKGPSTKYDLVGHLSSGTLVKVLGQYGEKGWYYIEYDKEKAFVSNNFLQTDKPVEEAKEQAPAEKPAPVQEAAVGPAPVQPAKEVAPAKAAKATEEALPEPASVLFIGDSRCVQMRAAVSDGGCSWICQNSKGYEWMESTAIAQADRIIGKGTKVVICLGVNDTGNVNRYASLVNQKAAEWAARGASTYYVSVNPVTENVYRTEEEVEYFNATLPGLLSGVTWIDTHTYLVQHGFQMKDGLHYTDPCSVTIFNLIISSL